ncbi:Omp28-related outer membrane protein [Flavobacteriaceae bacterium]|nr:Omp28-related outer membrane protein [Flavobacteriaceae bacterium]
MKHFYFFTLLSIFSLGTVAQTIVSTQPENTKVVIEEFTGIYCVFCPQGHEIAQAVQDNNPGDVFLINIHVGSFAAPSGNDPDYRTPWGTAIANQSQLVGYPAGTVNRHYFPGSAQNGAQGTAMSRGAWAGRSNETLDTPSYLNMAVESTIDVQTNELTVHVEAYYTGSSPESTNKLNVALLQNNTAGPQTGGNAGNNYIHMHRLIDMITGQWGEDVSPTTTGSFIDRTYTYQVPAAHNNVPINILDLEIVVFMTETTQEIISGNGGTPIFTGITLQNDAEIQSVPAISDQCGYVEPQIELKNNGNDPLESVEISYSVNNGTVQNYTWTGFIPALYSELVTLPGVSFEVQSTNTVDITLENDDDLTNNSGSQTFNELTELNTNEITLILNTDAQGNECTWEIIDDNGVAVVSGGPYNGVSNDVQTFTLNGGCYKFKLYDSGNNGGESIVLFDSDSNTIYQTSGTYGSGASVTFATEANLDITDQALSSVVLYPNPANGIVTLVNAQNSQVVLYDLLGKVIKSFETQSANETFDVSSLTQGSYFVSITQNGYRSIQKLIKN